MLSLSGAVPQPFATLRSWSRGASRLRCRFAKSLRGASAFAALCSLPSGPLAFTALAEGLRGLRPSQRWVRASGARPQTPVAPTAFAFGWLVAQSPQRLCPIFDRGRRTGLESSLRWTSKYSKKTRPAWCVSTSLASVFLRLSRNLVN